MRDRVEWSDKSTVCQRLRTHLLDYKTLANATYEENGLPLVGDVLVTRLRHDFDAFLETRAILVAFAAQQLAAGRLLSLEQLHAGVKVADTDALANA